MSWREYTRECYAVQMLKISVKAKPSAGEAYVKELDETSYEVAVKEPPVQGRANAAIIAALAEHFGVSRSQVTIISGWTSRSKVVEVRN